ncbi:MAG TPA: LptF/LptG family permease [Chitinophagales bacterium]|nr:LptF/LptG family permease [Chitinophagales bacterium]
MKQFLRGIDRYILFKFFVTYGVVVGCFVLIAVVFDITEKLDDFLDGEASSWQIFTSYYLNFIPYYAILLTPLLLFISVVFFTSRMTTQNEITAILNTGMPYRRLMLPYMIGAAVICALNVYANHYLLPHSNERRLAFEDSYLRNKYVRTEDNVYMQVSKNTFMFLQNYNGGDSSGFKFTLNKFEEGRLVYKLKADRIKWETKTGQWKLFNFSVRRNAGMTESLYQGRDTLVLYNFTPQDFGRDIEDIATLSTPELQQLMEAEEEKGSDAMPFFYIEKYRRTSFPFAIFILTLIGVTISTRKVRGGTGIHLVFGIALSFSYLLFQQFFAVFSTNAGMPPLLGVWTPNILYAVIAIFLYRIAPK